MAVPPTVAFYLHLLLETPASLNFYFNPLQQLQLSSPAPQARAVIQQYAVLLLSSNLIALIFALRPVDATSKRVAGALAVYHLAPLFRALGRIWEGDGGLASGLGGPWAHAAAHGAALVALLGLFFRE